MSELELIERCAKLLERYGPQYSAKEKVWAVLRESGHAELVAGLLGARAAVSFQEQRGGTYWKELLVKIDAALKKAGAL